MPIPSAKVIHQSELVIHLPTQANGKPPEASCTQTSCTQTKPRREPVTSGLATADAADVPRSWAGSGIGSWHQASRARKLVFLSMLVAFVGLTVAVVVGSPLDSLDEWVRTLPVDRQDPGMHRLVLDYVMLGQRGPSTLCALPWFVWLAYSRRSWTPLVQLATALALLNVFVGIAKIGTGRWGPLVTSQAHDVLAGGNIFPSGHTSNAVVLFGVMATLVVRYRTAMTAVAVWIALSVGLSTLYLDAHWVTDVFGGWLAGGAVLMAVPWTIAAVEHHLAALGDWWSSLRSRQIVGGADSPLRQARPVDRAS